MVHRVLGVSCHGPWGLRTPKLPKSAHTLPLALGSQPVPGPTANPTEAPEVSGRGRRTQSKVRHRNSDWCTARCTGAYEALWAMGNGAAGLASDEATRGCRWCVGNFAHGLNPGRKSPPPALSNSRWTVEGDAWPLGSRIQGPRTHLLAGQRKCWPSLTDRHFFGFAPATRVPHLEEVL